MIQIENNDLPVTVAQKLITATKTVNATPLHKAAYKSIFGEECGETVEVDMFSDDDLREIADHLYAYLREEKPKENKGVEE